MSRRDPDDQAELYRQALDVVDDLYTFARRLSPGDADDLVQETYARALAGLAGFERGTNLRAWLFRILRNAWIDQARRRTIDPTDRGVEVTDEVAPADVGRLRAVEAAEIEAAVTALPDDHREVVLLDLAGLTEREVAAALGVAVGTVKSRLARARAALRRRLLDYAR